MARHCIAFLGLSLTLASLAAGQATAAGDPPNESWQRLERLRQEEKIKIYLRTGNIVRGRVQSWTTDGLAVRSSEGAVLRVDRKDVARVTRKSRGKGALWGGIAGFGAAAPIGAYAGPYLADYGNPGTGTRLRHAAGWGLFFGGIGAGIGVAAGVETTIYRENGDCGAARIEGDLTANTASPRKPQLLPRYQRLDVRSWEQASASTVRNELVAYPAKSSRQAAALPQEPDWNGLTDSVGQPVVVVLQGNHRTDGRLEAVTNHDLTIDGKRFLRAQVVEVWAVRRDSQWTGAALGAAIGFGAGISWLAIMKSRGGDWAWSDGLELFGPLGAGIGFPTGYLLDRSRNRREVLYSAR
jgi:hypothetical protein